MKHIVFTSQSEYQELLKGPPETCGMHSGHVTLKAGQEMHRHTNGELEEFLVFLAGRGEVVFDTEKVAVGAGEALYIPPHTEHEVHSLGPDDLSYVYTVAPAK